MRAGQNKTVEISNKFSRSLPFFNTLDFVYYLPTHKPTAITKLMQLMTSIVKFQKCMNPATSTIDKRTHRKTRVNDLKCANRIPEEISTQSMEMPIFL